MSELSPALTPLLAMDADLYDARGWTYVLQHLAESPSQIEPEALRVVAGALSVIRDRLQANWTAGVSMLGARI